MKKKTLNQKIMYCILGVIFLYLLTHSTPKLALKSQLFFKGYIKEAYSSELKVVKENSDHTIFFQVSPPPYEKATHSYLETYKVTSTCGLIYWATYFGEV